MDVFGEQVSSLFDEFEKERQSVGSFISFDRTNEGQEDRSKIVFHAGENSDESESSSEDDSENETREVQDRFDSKPSHGSEDIGSDGELQSERTTSDVPNGVHRTCKQPSEKITDYKLLHERNKFQRFAKIIDSTRYVPDENSPACQILFQNNDFCRKYRTMIEQYVMHLIARDEYDNQRRRPLPELNIRSTAPTCVDLNNKLPASKRTSDMWSAHAILGCSQFHKYFLVDTLGWPLVDNQPSLTDSWEIPKYEQVFTDALPIDEEDDGPGKPPARPKASCFNCGGEHMMSDCREPRDFNRIRQNRDKFREQSGGLQKQSSQRYHKDPEVQGDSSKFRPGKLSDELRDALGLSSKELPSYIYKMRGLGYPPGWLEEAKVRTSGLSLFDKHGREVDVTGESMEDGEVEGPAVEEGVIDPNRIIEYPGFTVTCPDVEDKHEEFGMPPLQEHQLKSTLCAQLSARKRKSEETEEISNKRMKLSQDDQEDMDLEKTLDTSFVPPLPVNTPPGKPPLPEGTPPVTPNFTPKRSRNPLPGHPPLPIDTPPGQPPLPDGTPPQTPVHRQVSGVSEKSGRSDSPSLEDLELQYKLLQQRLAEDGEDVELQVLDSCEGDDDDTQSSGADVPVRTMPRVGSATSINTFGELGTGSPVSSLPGTPIITPGDSSASGPFQGSICIPGAGSLSKDYGTPIVKRVGVANFLPDAQKFGEGIEDHIPYENLPEATGTFEKMRGLIDRIRSKITRRKSKS